MKTDESATTSEAADEQAILDHALHGKPLAPEVRRRVRARAARITADIRAQHGVLDIGVPAIRELRGDLPT